MAESPVTVDWERLLPNKDVDDYFENNVNINNDIDDAVVYANGQSPATTYIHTQRSIDPPQSEAHTMFTAEEPPDTPKVPSDISFPSIIQETTTTKSNQQTNKPTVTFANTPKITNTQQPHQLINIQQSHHHHSNHSTTSSRRSKDPPEERGADAINQSSALLSYSQNTYGRRKPTIPTTRSIASQSTISTIPNPPPTAPTYTTSSTTPNYVTIEEMNQFRLEQQQLRQEQQQFRQDFMRLRQETNNKFTTVNNKVENVATTINEVKADLNTFSQTIGDSIQQAVMAAFQIQTKQQQTEATTMKPQSTQHQPSLQSTESKSVPSNIQAPATSAPVPSTVTQTTAIQQPPMPTNPTHPTSTQSEFHQLLEKLETGQASTKTIFSTYHPNDDVFKWKSKCLLTLAASKRYKQYVITNNITGERMFNPNMNDEQRIQLFNLTLQALDPGKCNLEFITTAMINKANGLKLWETIERRFGVIEKNEFDKDDLKSDFKAMTKQSNENHEAYLKRIEKKLSYLAIHNIQPSYREQAVVLLEGLKSEYLIEPIVQIRTGTATVYSEWLKEGDLKHTLERAVHHIRNHQRISGRLSTSNNTVRNNPSNKTTTRGSGAGTSNTTTNDDDTSTKGSGKFVKRSEKLAQGLLTGNNAVKVLLDWYYKKVDGCSLHPSAETHKFFNCHHVRNICSECGCIDALAEATAKVERKSKNPPQKQETTKAKRMYTAQEVQDLVKAKRVTESQAGKEAVDNAEYDSAESVETSSTVNDKLNDSTDLCYSNSSHKISCRIAKITPILREQGSYKSPQQERTVQFNTKVTKQQIVKSNENATYVPTNNQDNCDKEACTDSGCTHDMSGIKDLFEEIIWIKNRKFVTLGDNKTTLRIQGYGFMNYLLNGKRIRKIGYYVPGLGVTLLSIKQHIKYKGCYFHAENDTVLMAYPQAVLFVKTEPEFTLKIEPAKHLNTKYVFNEEKALFTSIADRRKFTVMNTERAKYISTKEAKCHSSNTVEVQQLIQHAKLPQQATEGSIGFDICSSHTVKLQPESVTKIHTGLAMAVPKGMYLRLAPRSGLSIKGTSVEGGVIDNDYRGEIVVLIRNHNKIPMNIRAGQRIAQCIFEQAKTPCMVIKNTLSETTRGNKGFGSSDYAKQNKEEAIACALRVAVKSSAMKQSRTLNGDDEDSQYDEYMKSTHEPLNQVSENKHKSVVNMYQKDDSSKQQPPLLTQDRVNSSVPQHITMNRDFIKQATGFHKTDFLFKHFNTISTNNVSIAKIEQNPELDEGEAATLSSNRRNKNVSENKNLANGEVYNMDIAYGPTVAIGGIKYALVLIDRKSKRKFIYGLKNLGTSIQNALNQFLVDANVKPRLIRTDFDHRLIGGRTRKMLIKQNIKIEAAPPRRQHQNGLIERHWQNITTMARNWLKSQLLPSNFWFFAVKRAVEIGNILPVQTKEGIIYTPYKRTYNKKVDFRNLFPMFSKAYVKVPSIRQGEHHNKFETQTIKTICVGKCPKSDSLLFYHPPTKTIISDADGHKFDNFSPSGPQFGLKYDGSFTITRKSSQPIHQQPLHEMNDEIYTKVGGKYQKATVLRIPIDDNDEKDMHVVQIKSTGEIREVPSSKIFQHDPTLPPSDKDQPVNHMYSWIRHDAKVTLFLSEHWKKPKQGILHKENEEWYFMPGRTKSEKPLHLPQFEEKAESMINNRKLFQGWKQSAGIINARRSRCMSNIASAIIAARRHVSAKDLLVMKAPTSLLQHAKMHETDKKIWDQSYFEEYKGLENVDTWEVITEKQYKEIKHMVKRTLPTMAIAVIKRWTGEPSEG